MRRGQHIGVHGTTPNALPLFVRIAYVGHEAQRRKAHVPVTTRSISLCIAACREMEVSVNMPEKWYRLFTAQDGTHWTWTSRNAHHEMGYTGGGRVSSVWYSMVELFGGRAALSRRYLLVLVGVALQRTAALAVTVTARSKVLAVADWMQTGDGRHGHSFRHMDTLNGFMDNGCGCTMELRMIRVLVKAGAELMLELWMPCDYYRTEMGWALLCGSCVSGLCLACVWVCVCVCEAGAGAIEMIVLAHLCSKCLCLDPRNN